jgi:hypothetical protein
MQGDHPTSCLADAERVLLIARPAFLEACVHDTRNVSKLNLVVRVSCSLHWHLMQNPHETCSRRASATLMMDVDVGHVLLHENAWIREGTENWPKALCTASLEQDQLGSLPQRLPNPPANEKDSFG